MDLPSELPESVGPQGAEYIKGLEGEAQRMFLLLRLSTFLHGLNELESISRAFLASLTSGPTFGWERAILFLHDTERGMLVGLDGASRDSRAGACPFSDLLDRFPDSLEELRGLVADGERGGRRGAERGIRRLRLPLAGAPASRAQALFQAALGEPGDADPDALPDPEGLRELDARGPWTYRVIQGSNGPIGLLALAGAAVHEEGEGFLIGVCHHAALALERGLTHRGLERRLAEMNTVQEITRGILSATNLEDLLHLVVRTAARALGARWASVWLSEGEEEALRAAAFWGPGVPDSAPLRERLLPVARQIATSQQPIRLNDGRDRGIPSLEPDRPHSLVLVPLVAFERTLGVMALGGRTPEQDGEEPEYASDDVQFLTLLAGQAATAIQNAQLSEENREADRRLRETQTLLLQNEKLAALGEMSAKVAHEIRNPLSAVGGFARRIRKGLPADDPNAHYAELIVKETERLEAILTEQLDFARATRTRLQVIDLNPVVQEAVELVQDEAERKSVVILQEFAGSLPRVLLDPDRLKQVLLNILRNALGAVAAGNRIQVRTARVEGDLRIEVANDGDPLPGEALESLFVPFATTRPGGSGLGLAVARQIVQDHGGEIQVKTGDPAWSVVFTVSFPVRENQDRRKSGRDRRSSRDRRRAA